MNMKLVTGNTLETSVEASDDRALHAGIVGTGDYVFRVGRRFAHQIIGNGTVRIFDGEGIMQGAHFIIPHGKYDDVEINSCVEGYKRIDLICAKYYKYQNAETVELVVVKGLESVGTPEVPEITVGSILEDTPEHNMPLKRVTVQGSTIIGIEDVFEEIPTISELHDPSWIPLNLLNGATPGRYGTRPIPSYRKIGNRVIIEGGVACNLPESGGLLVAKLPEGYRPVQDKPISAACSARRSARLLISASGGGIFIEWVCNIKDGADISGEISWVQLDTEYYVD